MYFRQTLNCHRARTHCFTIMRKKKRKKRKKEKEKKSSEEEEDQHENLLRLQTPLPPMTKSIQMSWRKLQRRDDTRRAKLSDGQGALLSDSLWKVWEVRQNRLCVIDGVPPETCCQQQQDLACSCTLSLKRHVPSNVWVSLVVCKWFIGLESQFASLAMLFVSRCDPHYVRCCLISVFECSWFWAGFNIQAI